MHLINHHVIWSQLITTYGFMESKKHGLQGLSNPILGSLLVRPYIWLSCLCSQSTDTNGTNYY